MVQYRDLRPTRPEDSMRKLLRRIDNKSTVPHGQKVAEAGEGTTYLDETGASWRWDGETVREYDARITAGQQAIAEAEAALEQAQADLEAARDRIGVTESELAEMDRAVEKAKADVAAAQAELAATKTRLSTAEGRITATGKELTAVDGRVKTAEGDLAKAKTDLSAVDGRLRSAETDVSALEGRADTVDSAVSRIDSTASAADRKASTAQTAAEAAKTDAATAQSRAEAANTKALEAAGIAAGKGKIIYQATAPTGANAARENLWVRTSDSAVHAYDGTSWKVITDPVATKAAQDAVKATADAAAAKTAADAAKARADQAVADAATAKTQADKALADAATANSRYTDLSAKLEAALTGAQQVFKDPSFEDPDRWAPSNTGIGGGINTDPVARTGARLLKFMDGTSTGFVYPATKEGRHPVTPGQVYRCTAYVRVQSLPSVNDTFRFIGSNQAGAVSAFFSYTPLQNLGVTTANLWIPVSWDWTVPTGWEAVRFGLQLQARTTPVWFDDFTVTDITEIKELTDQVAAAKKAAQDAAVGATDALKRANEALTSASGKSTVRYTTTRGKPAIAGTATGDTVFVYDTGGAVAEVWRWDGAAWVSAPFGHETIASIDLGKATVGYLDVAQRIRAGAITADKVLIGIGDNIVPNGDGRAYDGWRTFVWSQSNANSGSFPGAFGIKGRSTQTSDPFPIPRSGTYRVEYSIKGEAAGGKHYLQLSTFNSDGSVASTPSPYVISNADIPNGTWAKYAGDVDLDPGTAAVGIRLYAQHTNGTIDANATTWISGVSIREKVGGDLIVNGSITGDHVDANSVAAKVGQFVKVTAGNVEVTSALAARVVEAMTVNAKRLVVTEDALLNNATFLGTTVAERLNVTKVIKGRDAILDGTLDVAQLNVTGSMAASIVNAMTVASKKLVVTEEAILNHTKLLGTTVAEELNVTKVLKGRDAILTGTVDVAQLNVTEAMSAEIVNAMSVNAKRLIVTEDAILNQLTVVQDIVTPELIAERIQVKELAAEMMTSGGLQTSTATNRGVKISEAGIKAWDASGNQVMDLNGSDNYIVGSISTARQGQGRLFLESYTDSITGVRSGKLDVYPTSGVVDHGVLRMDSRSQTMSLSVHSYGAQPTALLDDGGIGISKDRTSVVGNLAMWGGFVGGNALQLARFDGSSIPAGGSMEFVIGFAGIPNGFTAQVFPMMQNANNQPVTCVFHSVTQNSVKGWIRNLGGSATGQQWNRFMIVSAKF